MSLTKSLCLITGAALSLSGVALAQSTNLDLSRSTASELKADALNRTSQLAPADAKFTVDVHGYLQFRYVWDHRSSDDPVIHPTEGPTEKENAYGFQNARDRVNFSGHIINESWSYFLQFGWGASTASDTLLEDAYGSYNFGNGWDLTWGKFKAPFLRENLVGDTEQLAVDRSVMSGTMKFNVGRVDGVQLGYETQQMRLKFMFSDGANTNNTDFISPAEADYALTARLDYKWQGDWKQAVDFTSFQQSPYFGAFGVAGHYQSGGNSFATTDAKAYALTADVSVEGDGWNLFGAAVYSHYDPAGPTSFHDWGFLAQGGVFVSPNWELFGRWDYIKPSNDYAPNDKTFSSLTVGANDYFVPNSHAAKFTVELEWFLDKTTTTSGVGQNTMAGLLDAGKSGQYALIGQMQIAF